MLRDFDQYVGRTIRVPHQNTTHFYTFLFFVYNYTHQHSGLQMNSSKLIRMLEEDGWKEVRVKGSHHHFKHPEKPGLVTVPHPKKDLPIGTWNSILKDAGLK